MTTGTPDFDARLPYDSSVQAIDIGEFSNRINRGMGSMIRSGSVQFADDFTNYIAGQYNILGTGTVAVDTTRVTRPGAKQSLRCTTAVGAFNSAGISREIPGGMGKYAIETSVLYPPSPQQIQHQFILILRRSSDLYSFSLGGGFRIIYYDAMNPNRFMLQLYSLSGNFYNFAFVSMKGWDAVNFTPHIFRVEIDFNTGMYTRVYMDNYFIDATGQPIATQIAATAAGNGLYLFIQNVLTSNAAVGAVFNIGDMILTRNEP